MENDQKGYHKRGLTIDSLRLLSTGWTRCKIFRKIIEVDIFGKRRRVYKTGVQARWLQDGGLCLDRPDHQIKQFHVNR